MHAHSHVCRECPSYYFLEEAQRLRQLNPSAIEALELEEAGMYDMAPFVYAD